MPRHAHNSSKPWSKSDVHQFNTLEKQNTLIRMIRHKFRRIEVSVHNNASLMAASLQPSNQSSYNRKKNERGYRWKR